MQFQQIYLKCLAQASYLVGDGGECAIVDPRRDVDVYLDEASRLGLTITHVIETHLHADFVSGHVELARRTGATIHVGHLAGASYEHHPVHDGDEIVMGEVTLRFLETPGHTPESLCVLVFDGAVDAGTPCKVLTGDTLFIGDVGRPDLVSSKGRSAEEMAGLMYDSLQAKLLTLPDACEVFPGHGAGSACGRSMSSELSCTIGRQKEFNAALQAMSRDDFIAMQTAGLQPAPRYFPRSAELNRVGPPGMDELPEPPRLAPDQAEAELLGGVLALDVRHADDFALGHVPGSINIGLWGHFATWVGTLLDGDTRVLLVADDEEQVREAILRMARVGHHAVAGVLDGGLAAWAETGRPVASHQRIDVGEMAQRLEADPSLFVLDVRREPELESGHVPGAANLPLHRLEADLAAAGLDPARTTHVICQGGYRSSAAAALLERAGFTDLVDIRGGTGAWIDGGHPVEHPSPASA
jgi:glyoxylase-like metal-dependent hydrolase (beta-lactamase superfamily II)/rhodanese-related sulfurtransferase